MIVMGSEGEPQQLLVIGGQGPISTITQYHHQFQYNKMTGWDDLVRTNEQNIYNLFSGQWTVPSVGGQCCPPTSSFIIERINHNKGIMYGGAMTDSGIPTNSIYLFQLSHDTVNWECLKQGAILNDELWLKERRAHASTIINGVSTSPTLVVIGGVGNRGQPVNDCLLLDTSQYNWMKIPLPDSLTGRFYHTVSSFVVDPNHVFLIIVGGIVKREQIHIRGGVMKWFAIPVTDPNITMVVELVFNDGQWSVGPVLDSFNIPLLYEQILKERRKELIGMNEYMTDKEKELQVINESLRHDLQVARIKIQSLQEALLETQSLSVSSAAALIEKDEMIQRLESQLQEAKSLYYKKDEEKQLVEFTEVPGEYKGKVIEIQDQDFDKKIHLEVDQVIIKKEKIDFILHEQDQFSIKGTDSVGVQFNYMIPSMGTNSSSEVSSHLADPLSEPGHSLRTRNSSSSGGNDGLIQDTASQQSVLEDSASTGSIPEELLRAATYAGLVYYEEDGVEDAVTFTAAKKLDALIEFIKGEHSQAKRGPNIYFRIASPDGYIELKFDAEQDEPFTGWTIKPHMKPAKLYQEDIFNFGKEDYSLPPSCMVSVYGAPDAVPTLHYSVPIEGVSKPVTLYIHRSRRTTYPTADAASSSGSGSTRIIPIPTKRRRELGGFDIKAAKQKIKQVMIENHTDFAGLLQFSLVHVANKLFEVNVIPPEVQKSPTYDAIATCFVSMMNILDSKSDLEEHCVTFLDALSSVGGPIERIAKRLREKWTTALEGELQFEQSVKRVRTNE
uniref:Uncharacterized protein n=1 Tax=Amphimedon queenslandica TaxID=400682 RepID=A0A1X7TUR6_AMPQE